MSKKILASHSQYGTVFQDGSFETVEGKVVTKERMAEIKAHYAGANRIYKPMPLLFYTDVCNGRKQDWGASSDPIVRKQ